MTKNQTSRVKTGQSLLELIFALALFLLLAATAVGPMISTLRLQQSSYQNTQAQQLASQAINAVTSIKNQNWDSVTTGSYGVAMSGNSWQLSTQPQVIGEFTQSVTISQVNRDQTHTIVASGGSPDPYTKHIQTDITWQNTRNLVRSISLETYLTHWMLAQTVSVDQPVTDCSSYCTSISFTSGTCRANPNQCNQNSETYETGGDTFCTGGGGADTCCCLP